MTKRTRIELVEIVSPITTQRAIDMFDFVHQDELGKAVWHHNTMIGGVKYVGVGAGWDTLEEAQENAEYYVKMYGRKYLLKLAVNQDGRYRYHRSARWKKNVSFQWPAEFGVDDKL